MNITLSIDAQVASRAREVAKKMGKSLNQVVRDYLEQLAGGARRGQQWAQFEERCLHAGGPMGSGLVIQHLSPSITCRLYPYAPPA